MSTPARATIAFQQRRRLVREGIALLARHSFPDCRVVAVVFPDQLIEACSEQEPDVVVLDCEGPGADPVAGARRLQQDWPNVRFIGTYQARPRPEAVDRASSSGFYAVISHDDGWAELARAIESALDSPARRIIAPGPHRPLAALTARESEIVRLISNGCGAKEISERLSISRKMVENHKQQVFAKLGVQSQSHAVAIALNQGLITEEGA
jgi:DNA-binding NarL/FixJ family response regulator